MLPRVLRRHRVIQALYSARVIPRVQQIEFDGGARAWVDLADAEARAVYCSGRYWPELQRLGASFVRGGHVFDVGANWGFVAFGMHRLCDATFHLFEANPRIVKQLQRRQGAGVIVNHCCVTDRPGTSFLAPHPRMWGQSHIADKGVPVPNLVLDEYIARRNIQRVDFMKVDVEGWEPLVLRGAERALRAGIVRAAVIEVAGFTYARVGSTPEAVVDFLEDCGFRCYLNPFQRRPAKPFPPDVEQEDLLAIHRSAAP